MNCNCCDYPKISCVCSNPCAEVAEVQQTVIKTFKPAAQVVAKAPDCEVPKDIVYSRPARGIRLDSREEAMKESVKNYLVRNLGIVLPEVEFPVITTSQAYPPASSTPPVVTSSVAPSCPDLDSMALAWAKVPDGSCSTTQVTMAVNVATKSTRTNGIKDFYYSVSVAPNVASLIEVSANGGYSWLTATTNSANVTLDTSTVTTLNGYNILIRATNANGTGVYSLTVNPLTGVKQLARVGGWENRPDGCTYNQYQLILPSGVSITDLDMNSTGDVAYIIKPNNNIEIRGCKGKLTGNVTLTCQGTSVERSLPPIVINGDCSPCADCECGITSSISFDWVATSVANQYLVVAKPSPVWLTSPISWSGAGNLNILESSSSLSVLVQITSGSGCVYFEADSLCDSIDAQSCRNFAVATTSNCAPSFDAVQTVVATCNGSVAQSNARLIVTGIENGTRFGYSTGVSYSGPGYAALTAPGNQIVGTNITIQNLPNPVNPNQIYTIRIFNGTDGCYRDISVSLARTTCAGGGDGGTSTSTSSTPPLDDTCTSYTVYGGTDPEAGAIWSYVCIPCCETGQFVFEYDANTGKIEDTICAKTGTVAAVVGVTGILPGDYCDDCDTGGGSTTTSVPPTTSTPPTTSIPPTTSTPPTTSAPPTTSVPPTTSTPPTTSEPPSTSTPPSTSSVPPSSSSTPSCSCTFLGAPYSNFIGGVYQLAIYEDGGGACALSGDYTVSWTVLDTTTGPATIIASGEYPYATVGYIDLDAITTDGSYTLYMDIKCGGDIIQMLPGQAFELNHNPQETCTECKTVTLTATSNFGAWYKSCNNETLYVSLSNGASTDICVCNPNGHANNNIAYAFGTATKSIGADCGTPE